jgi:Transposase
LRHSSGRSRYWIKSKNPNAPAVKQEAEERFPESDIPQCHNEDDDVVASPPVHCDKSPDELPQRPIRSRSLAPDCHRSRPWRWWCRQPGTHPRPAMIHRPSPIRTGSIAVAGIDIGKNSFHVMRLDKRGAIVLRQKLSARPGRSPTCQYAALPDRHGGLRRCASSQLKSLGHDARLMPAKYVRPYSKGQKNDFRDAEAIAEAVQRPTMRFVATKTVDQLDLQALHRVREWLVGQRTGMVSCQSSKLIPIFAQLFSLFVFLT